VGRSNTIAAALFFAFVVFITMRGELANAGGTGYLQILGLK
jgi:hypothetical protein